MAKVPMNFNTGSSGPGMLTQGEKPSDTNLLMAAADMHSEGAFNPKMPSGPERPKLPSRAVRKLKVVK